MLEGAPTSRLADRLAAARRRYFVGRATERALFQSALDAPELPFLVLYVFGPGGVGKSSLLNEFATLAEQMGAAVARLDARNLEPSPDTFLAALHLVLGIGPETALPAALAAQSGRRVILIDTYELLAPLDNWLRDVFLPQLPGDILVVLAGRNAPSPAWRADPGWQTLLHAVPLRNLDANEAWTYLTQRGVPEDQRPAVLRFTHGHPLALSLVAETFAQREAVTFQPENAPDIIRTLVEQFVQKAPGPAHRAALEACAQVRLLNEPLLGAMLMQTEPHELFDWLRGLSFIESSPLGIYPHDLAREALIADLRWRHPDWYTELHRRARAHYLSRIGVRSREEQQRLLFDLVYLHRYNPAVRPFFEWAESGTILPDAYCEADRPALLQMVARHEGPESAEIAAYWLDHQPEGFMVFRDPQQRPGGFMALVGLDRATPADLGFDPAAAIAAAYLERRAPLRPAERATLFRFWMAQETYQTVSPAQSLVFVQAVIHYLTTPGLAFTFFPCADPQFWAPVLAYANLTRFPEADFEVGGRQYGVYGNDWRVFPPLEWLAAVGQQEVGAAAAAPQRAAPLPPAKEQVLVLSRSDFAAAMREALHDFTRPDLLGANPLTRSRLVLDALRPDAGSTPRDRGLALQGLIRAAADALQSSPRDAKLHRALHHTYFQPAPTQERAAELLDLPFSTYRRHLTAGIAELTEALWQREVGG